jgi:uncharacterized membrane protein YoaK (UPF0700 family)
MTNTSFATRLGSDHERLHLALMLALTFSTGAVDAVGYLGLDRVFTGNMTGNVVILAMALTGADGLPVIGPVIALALFMVGAATAGRALRKQPVGWSARTTTLLTVVAGILVLTTVAAFVSELHRPEWVVYAITGALGLAMGMQGGAARQIGIKDVTTVVVTSTLVGLAFDSVFGGNAKQQWKRRAGAVLLIGAGAATGALLLRIHLGFGTALAALITVVVAILGHIGRPVVAKQTQQQ